MDTDSFIVYIKTKEFYVDIAYYVEKSFETSNYELENPLPRGKYKKITRLMNCKLDRKTIKDQKENI